MTDAEAKARGRHDGHHHRNKNDRVEKHHRHHHSDRSDDLRKDRPKDNSISSSTRPSDSKHHHHHHKASGPGVEHFDGDHHLSRLSAEERFREKERRHDHHGSGSRASTTTSGTSRPSESKGGYHGHHHIAPARIHSITAPLSPEESRDRQEGMAALEATTALDLNEMLEAARQQGREEGQQERGAVAEITNGKKKKRLFATAFCFLVAVAVGVVTWALLNRNETSDNPQVSSEPSLSPSSGPTSYSSGEDSNGDSNMIDDTCLAIANGDDVQGQGDLAAQEYDILLDVELDDEPLDLGPVTLELQEKIQRFLAPSLAGCSEGEDRRLQSKLGIVNAVVEAQHDMEGTCLQEYQSPCFRFVILLDLYVAKLVNSYDFSEVIMATFEEEPIVNRLGLMPPFVKVTVVRIVAQVPTTNPTGSPSQSPTFAPVTYPSTLAPTRTPSMLPSGSPSGTPTRVPSTGPTARPSSTPTPLPTPSPTPFPTPGPTPLPTPVPTPAPTLVPTPAPSSVPTQVPSTSPSKIPTPFPTTSPPTKRPTPLPTPLPSSSVSPTKPCFQSNTDLKNAVGTWSSQNWNSQLVIAQYGPIEEWCFGPAVTSMQALFSLFGSFNEDISAWDVSGITDMDYMFNGAREFNQDISQWDVSSVMYMDSMFYSAGRFNQNISNWNVASVTTMRHMFQACTAFNQDLSGWDVSSVTGMNLMFYAAGAFNQNLCAWGQRINSASVEQMFRHTACPTAFTDVGWGQGAPNLYNSPPGPFCHVCS